MVEARLSVIPQTDVTVVPRISPAWRTSTGSVPDTTRRRIVEVRNHPAEVRIFEDGQLIASHPVLEGKNQRRVDPSHRKPVPAARRMAPALSSPVDAPVARRPLAFYEAVGRRLANAQEGRP